MILIFLTLFIIATQKTLLIIDNDYLLYSHKTFINDLKQSYDLAILNINKSKIQIKKEKEFLYENILILAPSQGYFSNLDLEKELVAEILEFFDSGKNIFIAADVDSSQSQKELLVGLGIQLTGNYLIDYFNNEYDPLIIKTQKFSKNANFVANDQKPILYKGTGLQLSVYENKLQYTIASPEALAGAFTPSLKVKSIGESNVLVVGIQGRYNGRVVITGSLDLMSNELYQKSQESNKQFVNNLIKWGFNEKGKLRISRVFHSKIGENEQPQMYKIKDELRFEIDIEEFSENQWINYEANDLQLEFYMLDPYQRVNLQHIPGTKTFFTEMKVPDKHGVFKFWIKYQKPGYSFIDYQQVIPVRPYNHNEYERFIYQAIPYYMGYWLTLFGFIVFIFFFMFHDEENKLNKKIL